MTGLAPPTPRVRSVLYVEASEYWGAPLALLVGMLAEPVFQEQVRPTVAASSGVVHDRLRALERFPVHSIPARRLSRSGGWRRLAPSALLLMQTTASLVRLVRRLRPDLIHGNSLNGALFASWAAGLTHTPLLWHMHDVLREDRLNRSLVRWLAARSARVVAVSQAVSQSLCRLGMPAGKLRVIYNGLRPDCWRVDARAAASARQAWGIPADAVVFLHMGSLVRLKGQALFLDAAQACAATHPQAFFLLIGSPLGDHDADYAEAVVRRARNAGPAFRYIPALDDPRQAYAAADVLALTSTWPEALGMVMLEAMACGKPVIASRLGGPLEIVEDGITGLLFEPGHVNELSVAFQTLMTRADLRQQMGAAGQRRFETHFTLERQVRGMLELYGELVPAHRLGGL
jgi:glycosyltransferase involved in cell wall biosynthesis